MLINKTNYVVTRLPDNTFLIECEDKTIVSTDALKLGASEKLLHTFIKRALETEHHYIAENDTGTYMVETTGKEKSIAYFTSHILASICYEKTTTTGGRVQLLQGNERNCLLDSKRYTADTELMVV